MQSWTLANSAGDRRLDIMSKEERKAAEAAEEAAALNLFKSIGLDDTVAKYVERGIMCNLLESQKTHVVDNAGMHL